MDDALLVRGLERVGDLPGDRQRLGQRHRSARDAIADRSSPSTSSITSARAAARSVLDAVDVRDVRVVQRRQHLRFAREPREAVGVAREAARAGP